MSDGVREAAARLRDNGPYDFSQAATLTSRKLADLWAVWEDWSAKYPADDAEPVTDEWLRAMGFKEGQVPGCYFRAIHHGHDIVKTPTGWAVNCTEVGFGLPAQPSRGHVRRLLAALGVGPKG